MRELKAAAERFAIGLDATGRSLAQIIGPVDPAPAVAAGGLAERVAAYEKRLIEVELARHNASIAAAADALQVPRRTLSEKINRLGIYR